MSRELRNGWIKGGKLRMARRIGAWAAIAGFIFLILNLFWIKWYTELSAVIYIIIVVIYVLFFMGKKKEEDMPENVKKESSDDNREGNNNED